MKRIFDVRGFGASGNGATKDTAAIQRAIDAAAAAGGGEILLPAGTYLSGTLCLADGCDFHLEEGAVLKASRATTTPPTLFPRMAQTLATATIRTADTFCSQWVRST